MADKINDLVSTAIKTNYGFYEIPLSFFPSTKEPRENFSFKKFTLENFRGIKNISLNFARNDLVLLLGLNESGKTSILKGIEAFDFHNDPEDAQLKKHFFSSMRDKQDITYTGNSILTAEIVLNEQIQNDFFNRLTRKLKINTKEKNVVKALAADINTKKQFSIARIIPFNNGEPQKTYYKFEGINQIGNSYLESALAQEVVSKCPFIIYFEDFQDTIPSNIKTSKRQAGFNSLWYEIIEGLFRNTDNSYSIKSFLEFYSPNNRRENDALTVRKRVNKTLQETFTNKWKDLSGVDSIEEAELHFQEKDRSFNIKITEKDGTTYSTNERSKGAIWYLSFLMKTEFRRKILREGSGKPIYLIDEPAYNLHSTAQEKMVGDFNKLVEDTTLVYTTHSRYLVSAENIKNTYIVSRDSGAINCVKWGKYIQGKTAKVSYYQPLYDCLNIVPNSMDVSWKKAIIAEGPSDATIFKFMHLILDENETHAIYPGGSASNLETLISLNLGWNTKFKIFLDNDKEGKKNKKKYIERFNLLEDDFYLLPENSPKIEDIFNSNEKAKLYEIVFKKTASKKVKKKIFLNVIRALLQNITENKIDICKVLSDSTIKRFKDILSNLKA